MFTTYEVPFFDLSLLISANFWLGYLVVGLVTGFALVLHSLFSGDARERQTRARMVGAWPTWKVFTVFGLAVLLWWLTWYWAVQHWHETRWLRRIGALNR